MSTLTRLVLSVRLMRVFLLMALFVSASVVSRGQAAQMLDASKFRGAPDMCAQINAAYLSADFHGSIDATAFTGLQECISNPFHGQNVPVHLYLNPDVTIITSVPWFTPQATHSIEGLVAGNIGSNPAEVVGGATIEACGTIIPAQLPMTFMPNVGPPLTHGDNVHIRTPVAC
jgi:hypothetical protein